MGTTAGVTTRRVALASPARRFAFGGVFPRGVDAMGSPRGALRLLSKPLADIEWRRPASDELVERRRNRHGIGVGGRILGVRHPRCRNDNHGGRRCRAQVDPAMLARVRCLHSGRVVPAPEDGHAHVPTPFEVRRQRASLAAGVRDAAIERIPDEVGRVVRRIPGKHQNGFLQVTAVEHQDRRADGPQRDAGDDDQQRGHDDERGQTPGARHSASRLGSPRVAQRQCLDAAAAGPIRAAVSWTWRLAGA